MMNPGFDSCLSITQRCARFAVGHRRRQRQLRQTAVKVRR